MKKVILFFIIAIGTCLNLHGQGLLGGDQALSAAWNLYTKSHKAAINGATYATAATIPEIEWYNSKTREYVDYRKKYYLYLDSIQGKLMIYMNAVGIGLEINDLIRSFRMVTFEFHYNPQNFLAVSLAREKRQTVLDVVNLIGELNRMFFGVDISSTPPRELRAKVKETERYKKLEEIRLKIRDLSNRIRKLAFDIHTTNFYTLYRKWLTDYEFRKVDKNNVSLKCIEYWKNNAKIGIQSFN